MDIVNHTNFKQKKVIFSKPNKYENKFKIKVYVLDDVSKKLNKLCLITPMCELNINWKTLKYQTFKINLDPLYGSILDFYNLIIDIENIALDELMKYFGDNCTFRSIISESVQYDDQFVDSDLFTVNVMNLRLLKTTNVFDVNGKKTNMNDLELNGLINYKFLLELTDLWYDIDTNLCGCNFNVIQIKHFPNYYEHDLIITNDNNNNIVGQNESKNIGICKSIGIGIGIGKGKGKGKGKTLPPPPPPKMSINILSTNINSTTIKVSNDIKPFVPVNKPILSLDPTMLKNALANLKKVPL